MISQFLDNDTYRVVIREVMSVLVDRLRSCLAGLANVCLVQNTWIAADFRCAEISKKTIKRGRGPYHCLE